MGRADEVKWRGLTAVDGRLWYKPPRPWWRRPSLWFAPAGVVVVEPAGGPERALAWDDGLPIHADEPMARGGPAWALEGVPGSRVSRPGLRVRALDDRARRTLANGDVWLPSWGHAPLVEVPALARFLRSYAPARAGLGDPAAVSALVSRMRDRSWRRPRPRGEPLAGRRLDIHDAVERAARHHDWPILAGRPIHVPGLPNLEQATDAVIDLLAPRSPLRDAPDAVRNAVQRRLATGPWPFAALLYRQPDPGQPAATPDVGR